MASSSLDDCAAATAARACSTMASTRECATNYRLWALAVSVSFANADGSVTASSASTLRSRLTPAFLRAAMNFEYESPTWRHAALIRTIQSDRASRFFCLRPPARLSLPEPVRLSRFLAPRFVFIFGILWILLFVGSPRTAGPQPRDVLRLALR